MGKLWRAGDAGGRVDADGEHLKRLTSNGWIVTDLLWRPTGAPSG